MSYRTVRVSKSKPRITKSASLDRSVVKELPGLRRKRTLQLNRLKKILEIAEASCDDVSLLDTLSIHISALPKIIEGFESAHSDILDIISDDEFDREDEIRTEFDDIHFEILAIHKKNVPDFYIKRNNKQVDNSSKSNIKLPKINLPCFSGQIKAWPKFFDLFNSLIHNNDSLSDTMRMQYLETCLSGDALGVIRAYPIQGKYYRGAYDALVARYRDKRDLAFTCWKEILNVNLSSPSSDEFRQNLDLINENLNVLSSLNLPTHEWDFILCYLILSKLDSRTRHSFEQRQESTELPRYEELKIFLYNKADAFIRDSHFSSSEQGHTNKSKSFDKSKSLKSVSSINSKYQKKTSVFLSNTAKESNSEKKFNSSSSHTPTVATVKCSYCLDNHLINKCSKFALLSVAERSEYARTHRWCFNCLKPSHSVKDCRSLFKCHKCRQRHHTLLHEDNRVVTPSVEASKSNERTTNEVHVMTSVREHSIVLLSTAIVHILDSSGIFQPFRALIDSGSQSHFITENAVQRLALNSIATSQKVSGLGHSKAPVSGMVSLDVGTHDELLFSIKALTLSSICGKMPSIRLDKSSWHHLKDLQLADPNCHKPGPIDLLIGAECFASLLLPEVVKGDSRQPSALNSVFGWLLVGNVGYSEPELRSFFAQEELQLHDDLKKLWQLEQFSNAHLKPLTVEEQNCERIYKESHTRDTTGRYIVSLPFRNDPENKFLGSRDIALRCFYSIEKRLLKDVETYNRYCEFMKEYIDQGHMNLVPPNELNAGKYFIPHHFVLRTESSTTPLRVVFNASAKDETGRSLNDALLVGQKLQTNIIEILLKFRLHSVVFTADMKQMYRQILIREPDRDYQRIFWRFDNNQPVQEYCLNTVTYGVSSAPFLACRTIKQLIQDEGNDFPLASRVLEFDIYVDDIITGFGNFSEAKTAQEEIITLLKRGHFELRKWASNVPKLLAELPREHCLTDPISIDVDNNPTLKILGLKWDPCKDSFLFSVIPHNKKCSKRNILSELARIYDPLGFLSPVILIPKVLVQRLWVLGIHWDEDPSDDIIQFWSRYLQELPLLESLQIPRFIPNENCSSCELHGFSDSSETGYGGVIYLRTVDAEGNVQIFFVCSKARVAPTKSISLPRLELCAAVLLADLLKFVIDVVSVSFSFTNIFAWSDSTIVLAWLRSHSSRWKTFVANRVSHIHEIIPDVHWRHVVSADNPADIASRGQLPSDLVNNSLWWAGPFWLRLPPDQWPHEDTNLSEDFVQSEEKILKSFLVSDNVQNSFLDTLLNRYSSIRKIQRVVCWWLRFIQFLRHKSIRCSDLFLSRAELHAALLIVVRHNQQTFFKNEIQQLQEKQLLSKQMRKLNPFLDSQGILRVGGRLARSGLEFEHKHPALLPRHSCLTYLVIEAVHRENCHAGVNTTQYLLSQQFWILSSKRAIRHCLSRCVSCYKLKPTPLEPFMSELPAVRVNQTKPFSIVGTDYGGPFRIKTGKHRGAKITKAYLCLFVCLATRAVHLEVVSDLSSDAFLAALRRFSGRRGRVSIIHSDCGTNYVGANAQLNNFMQNAANANHIEFRFNPPSSPHFGGVWEIQIKAVKSHLYRIVGNQCLTFEELTTLFIQIESMLNSRPLYPLSSDPNDFTVLTPGHFLTLEPLTTVPDEDLTSLNINRLGRWQLIQRFQQDFWNRWKHEYLHSLIQRAKWTQQSKPLDAGSVVILKTDNTIPLYWPLARVEKLHPGPDGVSRIATIRTAEGSRLTRPLVKLCPLPNQTD